MSMKKLNKKGQALALGDTPRVIGTLLVVALALIISALILSNFQDQKLTTNSQEVANESVASVTQTSNVTLARFAERGIGGTPFAYNVTDGAAIPADNFTVVDSAGSLLFQLLSPEFMNLTANVSYNFSSVDHDYVFNITGQGLEASEEFAGFEDLIALVVVAVIILGLLVAAGSRVR